jgi:uncharacterized protein YjbI with pentapeptide repeats
MANRWRRIPNNVLWVLTGVAAFALILFVVWMLPSVLTEHPHIPKSADRHKAITDTRTGLVALLVAIGAVGGLAFTARTYRLGVENHRLSREEQITETYTNAVEQLGHVRAPVRLGAMYSLERLAQDNPPLRQTVIDVLCAYLRMPYSAPKPGDVATNRGSAGPSATTEQPTESVPSDDSAQELQVRLTAQRLIGNHLRSPYASPVALAARLADEDAQRIEASPGQTFWPGISLDLTDATLIDIDMTGLSVVRAKFHGVRFSGGNTFFSGATFSDSAWFFGAIFSGFAWFNSTSFSNLAHFNEATFTDLAAFAGAKFYRDAIFAGVTFHGFTSFEEAIFSRSAAFDRATFAGPVRFGGAIFSSDATFGGCVLHLDDPKLNKGGEDSLRVWPEGWTVRPDPEDPTRGTLVRVGDEVPGPGVDATGPSTI